MHIFRTYTINVGNQASTVILASCPLSKVYSNVYLLEKDHKKCGEIWETLEVEKDDDAEDDEESDPKKTLIASIYQLDDGLMIYQINTQIDSSGLNDLATKILENCTGEIVVLRSQHSTSFKSNTSPDDLSTPFSRSLSNSSWKSPSLAKRIERPNVVDGLGAAVLGRAEFSSKPATVLLNYSDSLEPDSLSLSGFDPLLKLPAMQKKKSTIPRRDAKERIARLSKNLYGNLYI